jgi:hypothetical protein
MQSYQPTGDFLFKDKLFQTFETREMRYSYRHKNDNEMQKISLALRRSKMDNETKRKLQLRMLPMKQEYLTIAPTKKLVKQLNDNYISQFTQTVIYDAVQLIQNKIVDGDQRGLLLEEKDVCEIQLQISKTMRVMILKNLYNHELPIRNGMLGTIISMFEHYIQVNLDIYPDTIFNITRSVFIDPGTGYECIQFPIRPLGGATISKIQSQTLDGVNIICEPLFTHGLAYSALTRSKTLKTIQLLGQVDFDAFLCTHPEILEYYAKHNLL